MTDVNKISHKVKGDDGIGMKRNQNCILAVECPCETKRRVGDQRKHEQGHTCSKRNADRMKGQLCQSQGHGTRQAWLKSRAEALCASWF